MTDNNLDALHNEMVDLNAKIKALQEKAAKTSQEVFKASLVKFFDNIPEIKMIFWRQYTPYFNDGDACEFSVGDVNFYTEEDRDSDEEDGWDAFNPFMAPSDYVYREAANEGNRYRDSYQTQIDAYNERVSGVGAERAAQIHRAIEDVKNMFREIDDDYFLMMFGDHVEVTATRNGFQVDEFDHD